MKLELIDPLGSNNTTHMMDDILEQSDILLVVGAVSADKAIDVGMDPP